MPNSSQALGYALIVHTHLKQLGVLNRPKLKQTHLIVSQMRIWRKDILIEEKKDIEEV